MRDGTTRTLPGRLEGTRRRFERWRRTRKTRSRIPEPLWAAAVKAAGTYGIHRTAKALRVDYYALKKRVNEGVARKSSRKAAAEGFNNTAANRRGKAATGRAETPPGDRTCDQASPTTFVEVRPPVSGSLPTSAAVRECILELEAPDGAKMRVHLKGTETTDLAALTRSFRNTVRTSHADRGEA